MAIKIRDYEVRLTKNKDERKQVRQLRYKVFIEEEGAEPTEEQKELREEYDSFDNYADYMAVFHGKKVVGTYRIINREMAEHNDGFYTETEFDLSKIKHVRGNIIEMSRACVDPEYRDNGLAVRMLWMGLAEYVLKHRAVLIFGVASFVGRNPAKYANEISYLYYNHLAPLSMRPTVRDDLMDKNADPRRTKMKILSKAFVDKEKALKDMPPLLKGYLRLNAVFGNGVFIDWPFNSCDVFLIVESSKIDPSYQKFFAGDPDAFDDLEIEDGPVKKFGKLLALPVTLPFTALANFAKMLLKPDEADEAEVVKDDEE